MARSDESEIDRMIAERFSAFRADDDWQPNLQRGLAILKDRRAAKGRRRRRTWAAVGAVAVCLPILAFPATRARAARWVSVCLEQTAAARVFLLGRAAGAAPSSTYLAPEDRSMAPDFTVTDALGQGVKLSDFRGKVVLLNFWTTACALCDREIPWFNEFEQANQQRGFVVIGVSMDEGGWAAVTPYIRQKRVNYLVMIGNQEVARLYGGLKTKPFTFLIDRSGRIAAVHSGACTKGEFENDIKLVLSGNQVVPLVHTRTGGNR